MRFDGLYNFRDVGGVVTADGRMVRTGLVFRSDALSRITPRDFVKLREVSLRYTFEGGALSSLLGKTGLDRATLNLTGRNVHTWTKYKGFDPEVGSNSLLGSANVARIDEYFYPNFRSFGLDVEMVF